MQTNEPATTDETETAAFEWAIIEIMGHRRHTGRAREEEKFGAKMVRIDVPTVQFEPPNSKGFAEGEKPAPVITGWVTHYYSGGSLFSYTPTDEATVIKANTPYAAPARYSLPAPTGHEDDDGIPF